MSPVRPKKSQTLTILTCIAVPVFLILLSLGNYGPDWMANGLCYTYFGCNTGFLGFDAFVHFVSGITDAIFLIWLMRAFPSLNILTGSFWKDVAIILSFSLAIGFLWELIEFFGDEYRMHILHARVVFPNRLYQPGNADTMGDLIVTIVGALLVTPFFLRAPKKS